MLCVTLIKVYSFSYIWCMKRKTLLLVMLMVFGRMSLGTELRIYLVDDGDKDVVRHVSVLLFQGKKKIDEAISTEKGLLWFSDIKPGNYTIQAGGWGYAEKKINVTVKDSIHSVTILMTCIANKIMAPFSTYNFDEGGYRLVFYRQQSDRNTLADSLGEFYIEDILVLKELSKKWQFKKPCPRFACGYHYGVSFIRNGKALEEFDINLNCYEIVVGNDPYIFTPDLLRMLYKKGKKFRRASLTFPTLETGRKGVDSLKTVESTLEISNPSWILFEGCFRFEYTFKKKPEEDSLMYDLIEKQIHEKHPGELFDLQSWGGSMHTEAIEIKCNKNLFDNFTLAPITTTWKAYIPTIHYYIKE